VGPRGCLSVPQEGRWQRDTEYLSEDNGNYTLQLMAFVRKYPLPEWVLIYCNKVWFIVFHSILRTRSLLWSLSLEKWTSSERIIKTDAGLQESI
jgi:hypothetical protein